MMRRLLRALGTLLVVAGVATLAWALLVWQWQDPFTGTYTRLEQRKLDERLDERLAAFSPRETTRPAATPLAARATRLRADARAYRRHSRRGQAIGRLRVPRLDLSIVVVNGTDAATLKKGPGRYLPSFMPGEGELVYVAGHRTTYLAPFADIDRLRRGDEVSFQLPYATFEYRVTRSRIVDATAVEVLRSGGREVIVLQACHPRFFASQRYLVYARPVRVIPPGADSEPIPVAALAAAA